MEELDFRKKYEGKENISTMKEFQDLFDEALKDANDYGSIVVCCALMMNAAFNLVNRSSSGGITGFQAGCLMWEMVKKYGTFSENAPLSIVDWNNLLYPQYSDQFVTISRATLERVQENAKKKLEQLKGDEFCSPVVLAHLQSVAGGKAPFGLRVVEG